MIEAITITSGFARNLPTGQQGFTFSRDLNLVYGPNGCGKSVLLQILASYTLAGSGGWSKYQNTEYQSPNDFAPLDCKANVVWDGVPSYYHNGVKQDHPVRFFGESGRDEMEEIAEIAAHLSAGQTRTRRLMELLKEAKSESPEDLQKKWNILDSKPNTSLESQLAWFDKVQVLKQERLHANKECRPTLILDEPERSLSIDQQIGLYFLLLNLTQSYQIIMASQSFLPLLRPLHAKITIHEAMSGIFQKSKDLLASFTAKNSQTELAKQLRDF